MTRLFHVTSPLNRASIEEHGLDWRRMGATSGIAGSPTPEVDGIFLCRDLDEARWFAAFRDHDVDVWAVDGIDLSELILNGEGGHHYVARRIPRDMITRVETPPPLPVIRHGPSSAYGSSLTITFDDGRVVHGEEAHRYIDELRRRQ